MIIRLSWNNLPFLTGTFKIRDLWEKKDIGKTDINFSRNIPPHDVVLIKLTPVK